VVAVAVVCLAGRAEACRLVRYTFQPDCFGGTAAGCAFDKDHPDFGPQIAVWVESADGSTFVDTLMVTNAVAIHGIANRPGTWNLRSGPRFPYGRRQMALPIWAHARGKLYELVVMEDMHDDQITSHEDNSSPEPYFCRPMTKDEVVDAITCPSGKFRSCKGRLDPPSPESYYPPRADLYDFGSVPCMALVTHVGSCDPGDSAQYAFLNDVDTVAAATPPYGAPFSGTWVVPDALPDGDYALYVEVGKEFDGNAANQHPSFIDAEEAMLYNDYGQDGNVGQPSVVYRVPFTLGGGAGASTMDIAGYGDFSGATGDVMPPDATISTDPGSGAGRLLVLDGPTGAGRVHVAQEACPPFDCAQTTGPEPVSFTATPDPSGTSVVLRVHQSNEAGAPVLGYEARLTIQSSGAAPIDSTSFSSWTPAGTVTVGPPDSETDLDVDGLTPLTYYAVGIRANGVCGTSPLTFRRVLTPARKYTQLSGCFIATAAFGSDVAPEVTALRAVRDAATARSGVARAATALYYRASPPLAAVVSRSETARALIRRALRVF
jgi:hypothetical protein